MDEEFLGTFSAAANEYGGAQVTVGRDVYARLGEPEEVAWFIDHDSGLVYAVPVEEVSIR